MVGVNSKIVRFCKLCMEKWNTRLFFKTKQEVKQSQPIQIRRRIFQGDSLSPLLFCVALISLTNELNRADCGYQAHGSERKISHLLYMDDLKFVGRNENDLKNEIEVVQTVSKDINMNFGLEKCARICLKRGRVQSKMHIGNTFENNIKELDPRKAYKYLGIDEHFDIQHKNEKEKLMKEYWRRLRLVLGTELSAKNKIQAIGSLAVQVQNTILCDEWLYRHSCWSGRLC